MALFVRLESPPKFNDYRDYKPFLRRDFLQMCAYCERSELAIGGEENFEIDHFRPKARSAPELETHYPNLYYSCHKCNSHKGVTWPSEALDAAGFRFADPCREDMYVEHLRVDEESGKLLPISNCGRYTCDHIQLNRVALLEWRQQRRRALNDVQVLEWAARDFEYLLTIETNPEVREELEAKMGAIRSKIVLVTSLYSL